jgi:hypothetical protein
LMFAFLVWSLNWGYQFFVQTQGAVLAYFSTNYGFLFTRFKNMLVNWNCAFVFSMSKFDCSKGTDVTCSSQYWSLLGSQQFCCILPVANSCCSLCVRDWRVSSPCFASTNIIWKVRYLLFRYKERISYHINCFLTPGFEAMIHLNWH